MEKKWHEIKWEEKHYFNNVRHGNYGEPVHALYDIDETGRPRPENLSKAGLKHYGYELPEEIRRRRRIEEEAEDDREKSKDKKGCCPSSSICDSSICDSSICDSILGSIHGIRCSINSITCVFRSLSD